MDRHQAEKQLKIAVDDPNVRFREGQWEAIDALVNQRRKLIVVQYTGWGKSSVYFISTRILRDRGAGVTVIVSPLLALMRNQIDAAQRLGIRAETINSTNQYNWPDIKQDLQSDRVDALLISPERLSNEEFVDEVLLPVADRVGLFVVDEVHCISDWGHDFRPDYQRLVNVLKQMPPNMPVLGTTATANNRVIEDIEALLGDIEIHRGSLVRKSLVLQTLRLPDQASRLAWLARHIPKLPGTGIVYVLTVRDAEQVAQWLRQKGIEAYAYYGNVNHDDFEDSNQYRLYLEECLYKNEIKTLVATTALGMGYDKPDVGFVVHYQAPSSVVAYYQQVGRAGRAIDTAYGVLIAGMEDDEIHEYFRRTAFPDEEHVNSILAVLAEYDELSIAQIQQHLNLRYGQIDKVLKILSVENPSPVIRDGYRWRRTAVPYQIDRTKIERLSSQREIEWQEVQDYIDSEICLMSFLRNSLDDPENEKCWRCSVCIGEPVLDIDLDQLPIVEATRFLKQGDMPFKTKVRVADDAFPTYGFQGYLPQELRSSEGRIMSRWGDAGWGRMIAADKKTGVFRDELVAAMAEMIEKRWQPHPKPEWVTWVPSIRQPTLVSDFAIRLAIQLQLPFVDAIHKITDNEPQKDQQNIFHQSKNLDGVFRISDQIPEGPAILVDDVIDSGWTMTVLTTLLRQAGAGSIYPVALASADSGN
ncbi:MAG: RecQ family ATP-dependent DNA helicase [Gemmatimonadetes bacterium]|nr:RecQ family ATP-dependent DNA helicase [Gemmatimonadota bacterium]